MDEVNLTRFGTGITGVLIWIVYEAGKQMIQSPSDAETIKTNTEAKIIAVVSSYLSATDDEDAASAAQEFGVAALNILPQFMGENSINRYENFCKMLTTLSVD